MKNEKLIVPKDLGRFLDDCSSYIGDDCVYFEILNDLMNYYHYTNKFDGETSRFIYFNMMKISEVISGKREYEIEEEEFYALIKGWKKTSGTPHWAYNERNDEFTINYYTGYQGIDIKMTKDKWNELGIDDSNAEFLTEIY